MPLLFWPIACVVGYVALAGVAGLYMVFALRQDEVDPDNPKYAMLQDESETNDGGGETSGRGS